MAAPLILGAVFFLATKVESIHLGHVLVKRSIPETPERRERFRKFALGGAILSAVLVMAAFPLAGRARPRLDHDLDVSTADGAWSGSRKVADFGPFKDSKDVRSQWTHGGTGAQVTVFAYSQALEDGEAAFHTGYSAAMQKQSMTTLVDDGNVPAPFHGFRYMGESQTKSGQHIATIAYFLDDTEGSDIHQISIAVPREQSDAADQLVRDLLAHAHWIDAHPPER